MFFQRDIFKGIEDIVSEDAEDSVINVDGDEDVLENHSPTPKVSSPTQTIRNGISKKESTPIISSKSGLIAKPQPHIQAPSNAQYQRVDMDHNVESGFEVVIDTELDPWDHGVRTKKDRYQGK